MPQLLVQPISPIAPIVGSGRTFHWYVTVEHPIKGEQGFYLDTTSDRFTDVMNAATARRLDLGLSGYRFYEAIDLGDLPF